MGKSSNELWWLGDTWVFGLIVLTNQSWWFRSKLTDKHDIQSNTTQNTNNNYKMNVDLYKPSNSLVQSASWHKIPRILLGLRSAKTAAGQWKSGCIRFHRLSWQPPSQKTNVMTEMGPIKTNKQTKKQKLMDEIENVHFQGRNVRRICKFFCLTYLINISQQSSIHCHVESYGLHCKRWWKLENRPYSLKLGCMLWDRKLV